MSAIKRLKANNLFMALAVDWWGYGAPVSVAQL